VVVRILYAALVAAGLGGLIWALPHLSRLPVFRVDTVSVSGARLLTPQEVVAASGLRPGRSVWDDLSPVIGELRDHPVIVDARIRRSLPATLVIEVEEEQPVAWVEAGALRLATETGQILPVDPPRAALDLPLVRVAAGTRATPGEDSLTQQLVSEAGRLARADPALMSRVSEIHRAASGELLLILGQPAVELLLPIGAGADRLDQVRAVLEHLDGRTRGGSAPQVVHLDARFAEQVVVRFSSSF
jgi:cell division septal protein FtsQ